MGGVGIGLIGLAVSPWGSVAVCNWCKAIEWREGSIIFVPSSHLTPALGAGQILLEERGVGGFFKQRFQGVCFTVM